MKQSQLKLIIEYQKSFILLELYISIAIIIMMIGMFCNFKAIQHNEGKMPVMNSLLYKGNVVNDSEHIDFDNRYDIEMFYLTDIIPIRNVIASVGDLLMFAGVILYFSTLFVIFYQRNKFRKKMKSYSQGGIHFAKG
jgi:hypothetical protein